MRTKHLLTLAALAAFAPPSGAEAPAAAPVLVELFTSQGCSSCPPAEDWLNTKGLELFQQGKILPLAFHVDYWDDLGWKDPFSSPAYTERQRAYAHSLRQRTIYTPEMVVSGREGFVGSRASEARRALADPANVPKAAPLVLTWDKEGRVQVKGASLPERGRLFLALFENGLVTKVTRGENRGAELEGNFVVRELVEVGRKEGDLTAQFTVKGDRAHQGVAAWVQDEAGGAVLTTGVLFPLR